MYVPVLAVIGLVAPKPPQRELCVNVWAWFLLIGAVEKMFVFLRERLYEKDASDTAHLRELTQGDFKVRKYSLIIV